jgi:Cu/Ag efflux protein CusF
MKILRTAVALAIAIGGASVPSSAPADQTAAPETSSAEVVTAIGTIQRIDRDGRTVDIKGQQGNMVGVKVGPGVNLDKLKVGDRVNAAYYREVAVALRKPGEMAPKMTESVTERGGITTRQTTITAKVVSVDPEQNTVVLRGPQNVDHSFQVQDPGMQAQLKKVKAGDNVEATYTQAVAVSVEPVK